MKMKKENKTLAELTYEELRLPNYRNTKVIGKVGDINITVIDTVIAAVLGGLNILLAGDTGTGKTQLASDIYNYYFGGNKNGIWFKARPDTEIADVFVRLNKEAARKELNKASIEKLCYVVDEINRAPGPVQDQFLGLGDANLETPDGKQIEIGRDGYSILIATANIGNGEFTGTFDMDRALLNRLHITFDLDYYGRNLEDEFEINKEGKANPKVRKAENRDITEKILKAYEEIGKKVENPGIEAEVVLNYLGLSLNYCKKNGQKTKIWPIACQDCQFAGNICEKIKEATPRTRRAVLKYAAALEYLAELKAKSEGKEIGDVDPYDLVFEAFKIAGAYHGNLNQTILRADYYEENARMMEDVVNELKEEFNKVKPYIEASVEMAERYGEIVTQFYEDANGVYPVSKRFFEEIGKARGLKGEKLQSFIKEMYNKVQESRIIEPYNDDGYVSLSWLPKLLEKYYKIKTKK